MAKKNSQENTVSKNPKEMSLEESRAFRASLYRPLEKILSSDEKREQFRIFWAQEKSKYGRPKGLEQVLWLHLKSVKLDSPAQFTEGLKHFGLKKVR